MKISDAYFKQLKYGYRKTTDLDIARQVSEKTGKPAITYLSKKVSALYLRLYPELAKKRH